jgi:hypothetical protein
MPAHYQTRRRAAIAPRLTNEGAWAIVNFHTSRRDAEQVVADIQQVQALVNDAAARLKRRCAGNNRDGDDARRAHRRVGSGGD